MINVFIQGGGIQSLSQKLARMAGPGSRRCAEDLQAAILEGRRRDGLAGIDKNGNRLAPRKSPRSDGGRGPVLAPHHTRSRSISAFFAATRRTRAGWEIVAGWQGAEWLVFHKQGSVPGAPIRDIFGFSPTTRASLRRIWSDFADGQYL